MSCHCNSPAPPADDHEDAGCSGGESFALRVLGDDMAPEFNEGDIIIVEPDGALEDGRFVVALHAGEWTFRQLARRGEAWCLRAINPARKDLAELPLRDLSCVHGVVIQKAVPGQRKLTRHYIPRQPCPTTSTP